ncbi:hypothetical protein ACJ2A9_19300 [Anaerobacillus sp. MEB173]|uniref:hypothetical protein n=1 Tax=Anaerobacillus sp. MEB173 TaxID=3383345 RepID=UPI003F8EAFCB
MMSLIMFEDFYMICHDFCEMEVKKEKIMKPAAKEITRDVAKETKVFRLKPVEKPDGPEYTPRPA